MNAPSVVPNRVAREERVALSVQVVTRPALRDGWSVNLSASGIGLVAERGAAAPAEGEALELEFTLPGERAPIRARGVVRWRHEGHDDGRVSLGVAFTRFQGADQVALRRFLATREEQVAVTFASAEERLHLEAALQHTARPHFVDDLAELDAVLGRGDVSSVVLCGSEALASAALARLEVASPGLRGPLRDLAPRVIFCAPAPAEKLVELFNTGRIFSALGPQPAPGALRDAVSAAARERGVRLEQRRVALALEQALRRDRPARPITPVRPSGLVLESEPMRRVMELIELVAPHPVAVLLQGETGTGKELLAHRLHELSGVAQGPFVVQDCGTLTETLLESELFGHVRGAFTGAVSDHPGLFALANGGTIFLDEIENTTAALQAKLLRVIETGEVRPVGGSTVRHVKVRLVAASNKDLAEEASRGRFRTDLYFRLNTFTVEIPPLRQRPADVLPLARHFLEHFNASLGRSASGFSSEAEALLCAAPWVGNVRELRNVVERAVLLSKPHAPIEPALFPPSLQRAAAGQSPDAGSLRERLEQVEREVIRQELANAGGVVRRAALALKMDPVTLGRRIKRYGLG